MLPVVVSDEVLKKVIPETRNPRYRAAYLEGRKNALSSALQGTSLGDIPLYSHNATYQSLYKKGWMSVSEQDIRLANAMIKQGYAI